MAEGEVEKQVQALQYQVALLAHLCGCLLGTVRANGLVTAGDEERLLSQLEALAGNDITPAGSAMLDIVRAAANETGRKAPR